MAQNVMSDGPAHLEDEPTPHVDPAHGLGAIRERRAEPQSATRQHGEQRECGGAMPRGEHDDAGGASEEG